MAAGSASAAAAGGDAGPSGYRGRNHVWMPSLGIDKSISFYACSNASYPGNRVYRWGCAGQNNVYLFGHAGSVFKPLHDAYVHGRLRKGAPLYYADGSGHVHAYRVSWWKLTTRDPGHLGLRGAVEPEPDAPDLHRRAEPVPPHRPPDRGRLSELGRAGPPYGSRGPTQTTRRPRIRRAITRRWIWLVPSPISVSFASRR